MKIKRKIVYDLRNWLTAAVDVNKESDRNEAKKLVLGILQTIQKTSLSEKLRTKTCLREKKRKIVRKTQQSVLLLMYKLKVYLVVLLVKVT